MHRRPFRFNQVGVLPTVATAATAATAVATATAAAAAITAATTTTAAAATRTILGFVDTDIASVNFYFVEIADRCISSFVFHFDETEAAGAAGVPVEDDFGRHDVAIFSKKGFQFLVVNAPREVTDK